MKNISSSKKTTITFIIILIIGGLMYFYTIGDPKDSSISSLDANNIIGDPETQIRSTKVLSLLNQVSSLKIDRTFFDDPIYKGLIDHTVEIPDQNIGRANPFEPYYISAPIVSSPVPKTNKNP